MDFRRKKTKSLIHNSYINDNTCGNIYNTKDRKISQIFETISTHTTDYDLKMVFHRKILIPATNVSLEKM